jgi:large subunit ribosomal protein L19
MLNLARRALHTSARVLDAATSAAAGSAAYPFSAAARIPPASRDVPLALKQGKGLMAHLLKTLPAPDKQHMITTLFSRNHPDRLLPGSVLTVTSGQAPTVFSGVLISIRRRGPDTSFVLRNVIQRTGVEMMFFVNSPHVQSINIVRKGGAGKGKGGRRMRRAKLFYLRDSSDKMTTMAAGARQ